MAKAQENSALLDMITRKRSIDREVLNHHQGGRDFALSRQSVGSRPQSHQPLFGISVHTAMFHVGSLIDKLDATGRTGAVAHAARLRVIHL